jgi:hypothetical protein
MLPEPSAGDAPAEAMLPEPSAGDPLADPLEMSVSLARPRLATALRKGIAGHVTCSRACTVGSTVAVEGATRSTRARAKPVVLGRFDVAQPGVRTRFVLTLPKAVRTALRGANVARLTVSIVAMDGMHATERTLRLKLKR